MENNQAINTTGRGPAFGHYPTFLHALAVAMQKCLVWREIDNGTPYTVKELLAFARKQEAENPLQPEQYYMVSREGAIGLSPGLEWLTKWMFLPMEPCKERDFAFRNMMEELHTEQEVEKAIEKAVTEGLAREKAAKQQAAAQPAPESLLFCPFCGSKLPDGSKFCSNCGNNLENI
ncbi:MAG: zinc ribbon domain-containing protein [Bacteroidales bacterium]|nr:zinc ribbon domain-containing protein [Bacteroidales bacterium]